MSKIHLAWKDYGPYEVNSLGEVWTKQREETIRNRWGTSTTRYYPRRKLAPFSDRNGYLYFTYCEGGNHKRKSVHRVVCEMFNDPHPKGRRVVNHINGNKADNRPENLEWVTDKENSQHSAKLGLVRGFYGDQKLTVDESTKQLVKALKESLGSWSLVAQKLNVHNSTVRRFFRKHCQHV